MKRKVNLALVKGDERSLPNLSLIREMMSELTAAEQEQVIEETVEVYRARQSGMLSYLNMGEHLSKVRDILEPKELWKKYASSLPNLGIATAYRMIWAWENASKALPPAAVRVAARDGYKLIAAVKGGKFSPAYAPAVRAIEREIGPAPDDEIKASEWLQRVKEKKMQLSKRAVPKDARKLSINGRVKKVMSLVTRTISELSPERANSFLAKLWDELGTVGEKKKPVSAVAA